MSLERILVPVESRITDAGEGAVRDVVGTTIVVPVRVVRIDLDRVRCLSGMPLTTFFTIVVFGNWSRQRCLRRRFQGCL